MTACPPNTVRIAFMGDIMLDRDVGKRYREDPGHFSMKDVKAVLQRHDLVIANLENQVAVSGTPHPIQDPRVTFKAHPATLSLINDLHIDTVVLANNHMLDYGEDALKETIGHLEARGLRHLGAGANYAEANHPLRLTVNQIDIAIVASVFLYSASTKRATRNKAGVADYKLNNIIRTIKTLKSEGYHVIVALHWGIEYCFYPLPYQRRQAQKMIDAGASLILGHGQHYPQGIETYGYGEIVHGVGNFIFDEPYVYSKKGYIYTTHIDASGLLSQRKILPYTIRDYTPILEPRTGLNRLELTIESMTEIYERKSAAFWKQINSRYFRDIVVRVKNMKSLKFIFIPPISFYFSIGLKNYFRKMRFNNLKNLLFSRTK